MIKLRVIYVRICVDQEDNVELLSHKNKNTSHAFDRTVSFSNVRILENNVLMF